MKIEFDLLLMSKHQILRLSRINRIEILNDESLLIKKLFSILQFSEAVIGTKFTGKNPVKINQVAKYPVEKIPLLICCQWWIG